jgi:hypothetical protein
MKYIKHLASIALLGLLAACGGGGGNPGGNTSTGGSGSTTTVTTSDTQLSVVLQDTSGVSALSLPVSGDGNLLAFLSTTSGTAIAGQIVSIDNVSVSDLVTFPSGQSAITDATGVARIKIRRASTSKFGIGSITLKYAGFSCASGDATCTKQYKETSSSPLDFRASAPALKLELLDSGGAVTNVVSSAGFTTLRATLRYDDGTPVVQKTVDITGDLTKVSFPEGASQVTDSTGIAIVKMARVASSNGGAGTLQGSASLVSTDVAGASNSIVVTGMVDYSLGATVGTAKLTLSNLDIGASTLSAYGTRQISVQALLGTAAPTTPVQISFSSNCGQVLPATVTTNAAGLATASFTATDAAGVAASTLGCSGKSVEIAASSVGADVVRKTVNVSTAPATNLAFVVPTNASLMRIYLAGSGGATQTSVNFLLSNARGEAIPSQDVSLKLKTINGGIPKATFGSPGNVDPIVLTTDSFGKVSVPVYSGTVPTSVLINASLVSNPLVQTDSSSLVVASGRPVQSRTSISLGKFAIRGYNFDGAETTVSVTLVDRQGNPVPDGTAVNFVTERGVMIDPICRTGAVPGDSRCTVNIRTSGKKLSTGAPDNGLVSILAYAAGEEDFVDKLDANGNGNNVYDCGESFTDLGTAFRDDYATSALPTNAYVTGEFAVPRSAEPSTCASGSTPTPGLGDGVWGAADVRAQAVIVFSTDNVVFVSPVWSSTADASWQNANVFYQLAFKIQDGNGNSVPTGSSIAASAIDTTKVLPSTGGASPEFGTCTVTGLSNDAVPNSLDPLDATVSLKECVAGDQVKVTVTTPAGAYTRVFVVQ